MKKSVKVICTIVAACLIAGGGYIYGNRNGYNRGQESQLEAMPKKTLDIPQDNAASEQGEATSKPNPELPPAAQNTREIKKLAASAVDNSWTQVDANNGFDDGTLSLYTSAQKYDGEIIWDDSQKWVVEIADPDGGYYTLYDQLVSNGSVYYDIVKKDDGGSVINVYTLTGAGTTIKQYSKTSNGYEEKELYNSGAVNRVYSSMPDYEGK